MEPWRYGGDQMVEGGVVDLPDNVHEAPIYPPRRNPNRPRGPGRRDPVDLWTYPTRAMRMRGQYYYPAREEGQWSGRELLGRLRERHKKP